MIIPKLKTKKCKRCKDLFFPNRPDSKICVWCVGKPIKRLSTSRPCSIRDCVNSVGRKGSHGFCSKHYSQLIWLPKQKISRANKYGGYKICETFNKCQIVFKDKIHAGGPTKYCKNCRRSKNPTRN